MNKQKIVLVLGVILCLAACVFVAACVDESQTPTNPGADDKYGKVLVVYYSLTSNTKQVAELIAEKTNGELYEITIDRVYPTDSDSIAEVVKAELDSKDFPKITSQIPNFTEYDVIFVGSPTWYYEPAIPVKSFLEVSDFAGKTVVPFTTYDGSYGTYFPTFSSMTKNAKVVEGGSFSHVPRESHSSLNTKVTDWLNSVDLS